MGKKQGEVLQLDEVKQTGTVNGVWSRITYQNDDGTEAEGYIPTSCLDLPDAVTEEADTIDKDKDAGTLHESSGEGVFADALEDVDPGVSVENGVRSEHRLRHLQTQICRIQAYLRLHITVRAVSVADHIPMELHRLA